MCVYVYTVYIYIFTDITSWYICGCNSSRVLPQVWPHFPFCNSPSRFQQEIAVTGSTVPPAPEQNQVQRQFGIAKWFCGTTDAVVRCFLISAATDACRRFVTCFNALVLFGQFAHRVLTQIQARWYMWNKYIRSTDVHSDMWWWCCFLVFFPDRLFLCSWLVHT